MRTFVRDSFIVALITFVSLPSGDISAQARGEIRVENIKPQLSGDSLTVSAEFKNLFSKKIIGTIQSGLPSIIEIQIKLLEEGKKQVVRKVMSKRIQFDIWEERYSISDKDSTEIYLDFEQVKQAGSRLQNELLGSRNLLIRNKDYTIEIQVGIVPISAGQANKVSNWLENPNQTEEAVAADNRASGFRLNVNKLVSFFVSNKKGSQFRSRWYSSTPFKAVELN